MRDNLKKIFRRNLLNIRLIKNKVVFIQNKMNSPFWNILRSIALCREFIIDETQLTTLLPGGDTVQADEELGAVVGVGVLGMGINLSKLISRSFLRAVESTGCF